VLYFRPKCGDSQLKGVQPRESTAILANKGAFSESAFLKRAVCTVESFRRAQIPQLQVIIYYRSAFVRV
jgi:hypothetical protein